MKKNIVFLFRFKFHFQFLESVIHRLLPGKEYRVFLLLFSDALEDIALELFPSPDITVISGYKPERVNQIQPDLVICLETWRKLDIVPFLSEVKKANIPILMYDHGSLPFKNRYLLGGDEYKSAFRSNMTLCSHAACWGGEGKENWLSFGVLKEKMFVTGAPQYDKLYHRNIDKQAVYKTLDTDETKKIILYFTSIGHGSMSPQLTRRSINLLRSLETFVAGNSQFVLVVKPHPAAMLNNPEPFPHANQTRCLGQWTRLIADLTEDCWPGMPKVNVNDAIAASFVVVSPFSSILIAPLILKRPIIHLEFDNPSSKDFSRFGEGVFFNLKKGMKVGSLIKKIEIEYDQKRSSRSSYLAAQCNFKNDGGAAGRVVGLIEKILAERQRGKSFYMDEIDEYLECQRRFPHMPFQYQNLIAAYSQKRDFVMAAKWFNEYCKKFKEPRKILKIMCHFYLNTDKTPEEKCAFLEKYDKRHLLGAEERLNLAIAYRLTGRFPEAITLFKQLLLEKRTRESKKIIQYELGLTYLSAANLDQAETSLRKVLQLTNEADQLRSRVYFRLGETYVEMKKLRKAAIYLKKCLKLKPEHQKAARLYREILI